MLMCVHHHTYMPCLSMSKRDSFPPLTPRRETRSGQNKDAKQTPFRSWDSSTGRDPRRKSGAQKSITKRLWSSFQHTARPQVTWGNSTCRFKTFSSPPLRFYSCKI